MNLCQECIALLKEMVAIPSESQNEKEMALFLEQFLSGELEMETQLQQISESSYNVIGRWNTQGSANARTLILGGHIDTVPPTGRWKSDPYTLVQDGDRLRGLGAGDMKGGLAAQLTVLNDFAKRKVSLNANIEFVGLADEERYSAGAAAYGERDTPEKTERIAALEAFFSNTQVRSHAVPNIVQLQWKKFMINISGNLPQAVLGVGYGAYFDSEHVAFLRCRLQEEVQKTAATLGISLELPDPTKAVFGKAARFSTLQDLDAKRHTEVDMFLGVLIQKAEEQGIDLPYSKYTYHAIKALEEKNDGLFNY